MPNWPVLCAHPIQCSLYWFTAELVLAISYQCHVEIINTHKYWDFGHLVCVNKTWAVLWLRFGHGCVIFMHRLVHFHQQNSQYPSKHAIIHMIHKMCQKWSKVGCDVPASFSASLCVVTPRTQRVKVSKLEARNILGMSEWRAEFCVNRTSHWAEELTFSQLNSLKCGYSWRSRNVSEQCTAYHRATESMRLTLLNVGLSSRWIVWET